MAAPVESPPEMSSAPPRNRFSAWGARLVPAIHKLNTNRDFLIAAVISAVGAFVLIFVQNLLLIPADFVCVSVTFATANFVAVIAQLADDTDVFQSAGRPIFVRDVPPALARICAVSAAGTILISLITPAMHAFGTVELLAYSCMFSVANWAYNLRRGQALMLHRNGDFRNTTALCAVLRIAVFVALAPLIGKYALFAEVIARAPALPRACKGQDSSARIAMFSLSKLIRASSYSTDALVQSQTLSALSLVASSVTAANVILVARIIFYATGASSQVIGTIFNRVIFQYKSISFFQYISPGLLFVTLIILCQIAAFMLGIIPDNEIFTALSISVALFAFPIFHPLSRLFTVTGMEWIKLILQLSYALMIYIVALKMKSWNEIFIVMALFSLCYAFIFRYLVVRYKILVLNRSES